MDYKIQTTLYSKIISSLLALAFIFPAALFSSLLIAPIKAEAQTTSCITGFFGYQAASEVQSTAALAISVPVANVGISIAAANQAGVAQASFIRDCVEHGLALAIARTMLSQMTNDIVTWINNDFNGNPLFISDPGDFLTGVGDQIAGEFIAGSDLAFLCSPFKLQVQLGLALNFGGGFGFGGGYGSRSACTLSSVVGNVEGFFDSNTSFEAGGGWAAWFALTQNNYNNPYGAYLEASSELQARVAAAQNNKVLELNWGNGFLSSRDENGVIKTPGTIIAGTLQKQLDIPVEQLGVADDLDKITNALGNYLIRQVITGIGGLAGATTPRSSYGGQTYLDQEQVRITRESNEVITSREATLKEAQQRQEAANNTNGGAVYDQRNVALRAVVTQSSISGEYGNTADKLVNGDRSDFLIEEYAGSKTRKQVNPWMMVELNKPIFIDRIVAYPRTSTDDDSTRTPFTIQILDKDKNMIWESQEYTLVYQNPYRVNVPRNIPEGKFVRIQGKTQNLVGGVGSLAFAELEVYENNPPVITLIGSPIITLNQGQTYEEKGATAEDERDGDISDKIQIKGQVNTSRSGTYTITYSVTDSGGARKEVTRQVIVQ